MKKILWIDLEMTGLNTIKDKCIEIAAIITDLDFNELSSYHSIIYQPQSLLESMDEWNKNHHQESGLYSEISTKGKKTETVQKELITWVQKTFKKREQIHIAGNSIYHDRIFLKKEFPEFEALIHYRMIDVTSWKLILRNVFKHDFKKKNAHRALDDIKESISELKHYTSLIKITDQ